MAANSSDARPLRVSPDRLFPADPAVRDVAREIYATTENLPIISPHSHVPPEWIADNEPFKDPTTLLLSPDHYAMRLLHANGAEMSDLGRGPDGQLDLDEAAARKAWRILCENYYLFRGTPVKYWYDTAFADVFGIKVAPSGETADYIYDQIAEALRSPEFLPRALFERFNISVLATTDDPLDDLAYHKKIADDPTFDGRVIPTFRPDRFLEPSRDDWVENTLKLGESAGVDVSTYDGWVEAMENRRLYFKENGAVSTDHSHYDAKTDPLGERKLKRLYEQALAGKISPGKAKKLRRHMVLEMARLSTEDGLVMTLHPAVRRNHDPDNMKRYGLDVGSDIPVKVEFTEALRPLLGRYGNHPNFNLVVFTMDETTFSRELAPLAGFYRSMYVGVPWWFIDAPDAIRRFRGAVTETAGFYRTSGFIDDTRAFLSIPARHHMSRRLDATYLAELVSKELLTKEEALDTAHDLVATIPKTVFKLD